MEITGFVIAFGLIGFIFWKLNKLSKEVKNKTSLYWVEEGKYQVLKNEKGEEITRL